jgi:ABC-type branched-subunit amino acid transport system ATPase component
MTPGAAVLEIQGLMRRFGGLTAVDSLDVTVNDGEIVSLVGPNGAGKTTVFNLISGVLRPTAGSVRLLGRELVGLPAHRITRHGIARTFQNIRVFPQLTVRENVLLGTHHWTRSRDWRIPRLRCRTPIVGVPRLRVRWRHDRSSFSWTSRPPA